MGMATRALLVACVFVSCAADSTAGYVVSPETAAGGVQCSIRGARFDKDPYRLFVGGIEVPNRAVTYGSGQHGYYSWIYFAAPYLLGGTYDIRIVDALGEEILVPNGFTSPSGSIEVDRKRIPQQGWSPVSIYVLERPVDMDAQIYFDDIPASDVEYIQDALQPHFRCTAPARPTGFADVRVVDATGTLFQGELIEYGEPVGPPAIISGRNPYSVAAPYFFDGLGILADSRLSVFFSGAPLTITRTTQNNTGVRVRVYGELPDLCPGPAEVTIVNAGGGAGGGEIEILPAPVIIESVSPLIIESGVETLVTIRGRYFYEAGMRVLFGELPAEVVHIEDSGSFESRFTIQCISPAAARGILPLTVISPIGTQAIFGESVLFLGGENAPSITGVEPSRIAPSGNTEMHVFGTGFSEGVRLFVGADEVHDLVLENGAVRGTVPPGTSEGITVMNANGSTAHLENAVRRTSQSDFGIYGVSRGFYRRSHRVYFAGMSEDFFPIRAYLGDVELPCGSLEFRGGIFAMPCTLPPHAPGSVSIRFETAQGLRGAYNVFTYTDEKRPHVESIWPTAGSTHQWTRLYIRGIRLGAELSRVFVGGAQARDVQVLESFSDPETVEYISCQVPPAPPGPANIVVVNHQGWARRLPDAFTYASDDELQNCVQTSSATPPPDTAFFRGIHSADYDASGRIELSELLRFFQLYNSGEMHCDDSSEDGFGAGSGPRECAPHAGDYAPVNWAVELEEILRVIQFFNSPLGMIVCPESESDDGFCIEI